MTGFGRPGDLFDPGLVLELRDPLWIWLLLLPPLLLLLLPKTTSRWERARNLGAGVVRVVALELLILAAAQPVQIAEVPDLSVVVAVDQSASMRGERGESAAALSQRYLDVLPEQVASNQVVWGRDDPDQGTDPVALLYAAAQAAPPARSTRVLLLTDGAESGLHVGPDRLGSAAALLGAAGVQVFPVPPLGQVDSVGVLALDLPGLLKPGQRATADALVLSASAAPVDVVLEGPEGELARTTVDLVPGTQAVQVAFRAPSAGTHPVSLRVESGDAWPEDDTRDGWLEVRPVGPVLVHGPHASQVASLLRSNGQSARVLETLPLRLPDGATLFLLGPDAADWPESRPRELADFVRRGGDLILAGGPAGLGHDAPWMEPLDRALPVVFPKQKQRRPPPLAVVYVLDRSDSMARGGKMTLAVSAIAESVKLLSPDARVGVLAFADDRTWVVPLTRASNQAAILQAVEAVGVGGGTQLYPALEEAWIGLQPTDAQLKHVILLTDGRGETRYAQNTDLLAKIGASDVTVSTVALSVEAARDEMAQIAADGHGRAYYTETLSDVPRIFVDETLLLLRRNAVDEDTRARPTRGSRLVGRADWDTVPPLGGHNRAKLKSAADVGLTLGDAGQPLLASWTVGQGSATVLATELAGGWGAGWLEWPDLGPWLVHLVKTVRERPDATDALLELTPSDEGVHARALVVDALGRPRTGLALTAQVLGASGEQTVALSEQAPGRYVGTAAWDGAVLVRVEVPAGPGARASVVRAQEAPPVPVELAGRLLDVGALERVAEISGGRVLPTPEQLLQGARMRQDRTEHWPWLVLAGLLVGLVGLGVRRIPVD